MNSWTLSCPIRAIHDQNRYCLGRARLSIDNLEGTLSKPKTVVMIMIKCFHDYPTIMEEPSAFMFHSIVKGLGNSEVGIMVFHSVVTT